MFTRGAGLISNVVVEHGSMIMTSNDLVKVFPSTSATSISWFVEWSVFKAPDTTTRSKSVSKTTNWGGGAEKLKIVAYPHEGVMVPENGIFTG
jgi:hypothetical protein